MARSRKSAVKALVLGLLVAVGFTLVAMLLLAVALVYLRFDDGLLTVLNQIIKLLAVVLGVCAAVPRGGERGLVTGVVIALLYSILGYVLYLLLGGGSFSAAGMLGEMMLGAAAGAVTGVIRANMNPKGKKSKR